ncbi:hypothetical protein RND81_13G015100 [Saponaria officinalis]|uniref:Uncharacterized protein n=1 Tax=Saponaria officinalis TaxID=3572 RepID=A0AAW1GSU4_SAPOF
MRFFKKVVGFLGFGSHNDAHETKDDADHNHHHNNHNNNYGNSDDFGRNRTNVDPIPAGPRKGFSVPVQVPIERPVVGPILVPCNGDGGVQGLRWYETLLKTDDDGDVADEFLYEVSPGTSSIPQDHARPLPRFQVKHDTVQAKIKQQALSRDGKLQHCVDHQGQLRWV